MLHYVTYNSGKSDWLVLIHGLFGDMSTWDCQIDALREQFNLLLLDLPYHGNSLDYPEKNLDGLHDAIAAILDREHIEKAHFVGFSLGALVATQFALQYPQYVNRLVLEGSILQTNRVPYVLIVLVYLLRYVLPYRLICDVLTPVIVKDAAESGKTDSITNGFSRMGRKNLLKWVNYMLVILHGKQIAVRLNTINKDLIFVTGEHDDWFLNGSKRSAGLIRNAEFCCIDNCSHFCHIDDCRCFSEKILSFCSRENCIPAK